MKDAELLQLAALRETMFHRFRLVLIGYIIFAFFVVAGLTINYIQTQQIRHNQDALKHDTAALARAIANGQTYLCNQIATLSGEAILRGPQPIKVRCVTQEQRYNQIISSLESH